MYGYEFDDDCKHKQIRLNKLNTKNKNFIEKIKKLDKSKTCVKYLIEYKGKTNLSEYIIKHNLSVKMVYSFILQIYKIIIILYDGKYSHNDLQTKNIMINKTNKQNFAIANDNFPGIINKKIPLLNLQLSAIDYGEVMHKEFIFKGFLSKNRKEWLFQELFYSVINIIFNHDKYINDYIKNNKKSHTYDIYAYMNGIKKIYVNHNDFYNETKDKYSKIFPKAIYLINYFEEYIHETHAIDFLQIINDKYADYYWHIINRIVYEFRLIYPELHMKYFGWISYHKCNLPKKDVLELLMINNVVDFVNYCARKI